MKNAYLNHLQKPYKEYQKHKIEKAVELWGKTLSIPCSVNLVNDELKYIIGLLNE